MSVKEEVKKLLNEYFKENKHTRDLAFKLFEIYLRKGVSGVEEEIKEILTKLSK